MKRPSVILIVLSLFVLGAVIYMTPVFKSSVEQVVPITPQKPNEPKPQDFPTLPTGFTGILRRVDMLPDQAQRMKLEPPVYIVDIEDVTFNSLPKVTHLYLKQTLSPSTSFLEESEGKCVEVNGSLDPLSMKSDGMYFGEALLGGFVLARPTIARIDRTKCIKVISSGTYSNEYKTIELEGIISRINRPSADIAYDYVINTVEPIPDAADMSGMERPITSIVVMPSNFETYKLIEESLGNTIKVRGYLQWGYAESQFFTIEELTEQ